MKKRAIFVLLALLMLLSACADEPSVPVRDDLVSFVAPMAINAEGEVVIDLGLYNGGNPLEADEAFNGRWELVGPAGAPRAAGEISERPSLPGGQETTVVSWSGPLEPGSYRLTWGAPGYGATVIDFEVEETEAGLQLGDQRIFETTGYPPEE